MRLPQKLRRIGLALTATLALSLMAGGGMEARAASEIKIVVNQQAITSVDIARRVAFLKLQRSGGNLNDKARKQLVDEALKMQEVRRLNGAVSQAQVDASFARFAKSNNMSLKQLNQVLSQAGVTAEHFKNFIRVQMSWPRVVQARYGTDNGSLSNQELVARMLQSGGEKPSTTEYILQQVIFVVPDSKRSRATLNARKREAEQLRARYTGCEGTRNIVTGLRDVTIRELGRVLQPQLPADWKSYIEKTKEGSATPPRVTERGVELIGICSAKSVSDDVAAAMVFEAENSETGASDDAKKYLEELRDKAAISNR